MKQVFSKVCQHKLLCSLMCIDDISNYRSDLCPREEYLQVSGRVFERGTKIKAHKHLAVQRTTDITQEAWIIIKGKIKATIFDLDNSLNTQIILNAGDCIVLFRGGHSLEVLDKDTIMYELKSGPYFGTERDKEIIDE